MELKSLGENIQTIRKLKSLTQQDLADKIGINLQNLSKIERGINYPTFQNLEKIINALEITPNELLNGKFKMNRPMESELLKFFEQEGLFSNDLEYGRSNSPLSSDDFKKYELEELRQYIHKYINSQKRTASDLYSIKNAIFQNKLKKLEYRYNDYLCYEHFNETLEGNKHPNPYTKTTQTTCIQNDGDETIESFTEYPDDFND